MPDHSNERMNKSTHISQSLWKLWS